MATDNAPRDSTEIKSAESQLLELRSAQLDLREQQLRSREREAEQASKSSLRKFSDPLVLAIIGAALGLIANLVSGVMQARQALDLEAEKGRANLVQEFIKTGDSTKAKDNLKFLLSAGILTDPTGKISKALESNQPISLPSSGAGDHSAADSLGERADSVPSTDPLGMFIRATGMLDSENGNEQSICTAVAIADDLLLTGDHCVTEASKLENMTFWSRGPDGNRRANEIAEAVTRNSVLDFAILRVKPSTVLMNNLAHVSTRAPVVGESLAVISAPLGQLYVFRKCQVLTVTATQFTHSCRTNPGSSGGILVGLTDRAVLGLHIGKQPTVIQGGSATRFDVISSIIQKGESNSH
jgi:hypothetical protein